MACTIYVLWISLSLCIQLATCDSQQFICKPEVGTTERDIRKVEGCSNKRSCISLSIMPLDNQTEFNKSCKAYLTLYGEYGTSTPTPINITQHPHAQIQTDVLGEIRFVTVSQENQTAVVCKWYPTSVGITDRLSNHQQVFRCERSAAIDKVSKLRRRRSTNRGLKIRVRTSGDWYAGTGAKVYVKIFGSRGSTGDIRITGSFSRSSIAENTEYINEIGVIDHIRVWHDNSGARAGWKLDWVKIDELSEPGVEYTFSCGCWLEDGHTSHIVRHKTSCPSISSCDEQRCRTCVKCKTPPPGHFYTLTSDKKRCTLCSYLKNCKTQSCHECSKCVDPPPTSNYIYRMAADKKSCYRSCVGMGSTKEYSVLWLSKDEQHCNPTCSYVSDRRCWPGHCSDRLTGTCSCDTGFKKKGMASCDINTKVDLITCTAGIEDKGSNVRNSTSSGNITTCDHTTDTYVNIQPVALSFKLFAYFDRTIASSQPNFVSHTKLGIVEAKVTIFKHDNSVSNHTLSTITLNGGSDCSRVISSTSPSTQLDCTRDNSVSPHLVNGEWICSKLEVFSGGSFVYKRFSGSSPLGTQHFTQLVNSKTICFRYDNVPPVHCSVDTRFPCSSTSPLLLSTRVTKSANITVSISGWVDPYPNHGKPDQSSGVDFYKLGVYGMKHLDLKTLTVDNRNLAFKTDSLQGSKHNITVTLTNQPAMYVVMLQVHDIAGNVRYARRFVFYDSNSSLGINDDKHLRVVSAFKKANYNWQINHGKVRLEWTLRYHNKYYLDHDYFSPIKSDTNNSIKDIYEQNTGVLPVTGTENINGITSFKYQWTLNNGSRTPWTLVPDFTNQSLSLDLNLTDGETYEVWIKAEDIMENSIVESVVVHIDSSAPVVTAVVTAADVNTSSENAMIPEPDVMMSDIELNTGDSIFINAELEDEDSTPTFNFHAYDIHSGILSVGWALRTSEKDSYVRSGIFKPSILGTKINDGSRLQSCATRPHCYCPSVGPCQLFTYSLPLDLVRPSGSEMDNVLYNHTVNITLDVTNGANLTTSLQLTLIVQEMYREQTEDHAGFWSTIVTVGVAIGSAGLVLIASVGVFVVLKRRKNGNSTQGRRSVTDSSPTSQSAEGRDHIYDGLKDAKETVYETIHNSLSAAAPTENVYQNVGCDGYTTAYMQSENSVVYENAHDRATVHTPSENVYENFVAYKKAHDRTTIHTPSDNIYANTGGPPNEC